MKGTPFFSMKSHKINSHVQLSLTSILILILLVVSLAMPSGASAAPGSNMRAAGKTCYILALTYSTNGVSGGAGGSYPSATPDRSTGCAFHRYTAGQVITLSATANPGWTVGSWSGTNNNGSTSTNNTLTMPAKRRTVNVNYVMACYSLTRTHTGNGSDPAASPTESSGCLAGSFTYHLGQVVNLTASPDPMHDVLNWNGTANDASTSTTNSVTIQAHDATVTVNYVKVCFVLTLSHTGNGSDPVASPTSSSGCGSGEYRSGEVISLTATADPSWIVASWAGANNNASIDTSNSLTMPKSDHTVTINFVEDLSGVGCYYLTPSHIGNGSNPAPSPLKSDSCPSDGYYVVGEPVSLTATADAGNIVAHWNGTDNDSLTTSTNAWTMTANNHVTVVGYAQILTFAPLSGGTADGWILESTEISNQGGTRNAVEPTFNLGDDASDRQYRSILSFSTGAMPDSAVILSVKMKIRKQGLVGTNPFLTHLGLKVDVRKPYFSTALGLEIADFQAAADRNAVGMFGATPANGWYIMNLNPANFGYINLMSPTQFRLRFAKDDNDDLSADYMKFYSGNALPANRPQLIVQYYVP